MTPTQIHNKKIKFLSDAEKKLSKLSVEVQKKIWKEIKPLLDLLDDKLENDAATVSILKKIEAAAFGAYKTEIVKITDKVVKDFEKINTYNDRYFGSYIDKLDRRYLEGKKISEAVLKERLGLNGRTLAQDGFLNNFQNNPEVLQKIRAETFKAVTTPMPKARIQRNLKELILETESSGLVQSQVNRYITDTYTQFDSVTQALRANRLGYRAAYYANNLIETSRCFCRNKFNKIWTVEEMKEWKATTKKTSGADCKAIYSSSEYIGHIHRGGYNCRHVLRWMPKVAVLAKRPELKGYYESLDAKGVDYL